MGRRRIHPPARISTNGTPVILLILLILLTGCNPADRPHALDVGADDEVVSLPGGGALLLRRALQAEPQCMVRARFAGVFVPMDCDKARLVNVR
jgi:hypothetical protein